LSAPDAAHADGSIGASALPLIVFEGSVSCEPARAGADWRLRGRAHAAPADARAQPAEVLLSEATCAGAALELPSRLRVLRLRLLPGPHPGDAPTADTAAGSCALLLEAREGTFVIQARAVRVHRDVSRAFFAAVPPAQVAWWTRAGWALLFLLLRLRPVSKRLIRSAG
jgi:hypothetical protein